MSLVSSSPRQSLQDRLPSLGGSVLLHVAAALVGWLGYISYSPPKPASVTPVSLVSASDLANARAALQAQKPQTAQAPEPMPPQPEAKPLPSPEPPTPTPAPAKSQPVPTPPKPVPSPQAKPQTLNLDQLSRQKSQSLDLDSLSRPAPAARKSLDLASLASGSPPGAKPSAAQRGPARVETAEVARNAVGPATALSADARSYLAAKLIRLWNPLCGVEDAANVVVRVNIRLSPEGRVLAVRDLSSQEGQMQHAAAVRALTAVKQAEPYDGLPKEQYAAWRDVNFNFIAKDACRR
jgi:outer membrane biosynthesis protein TonB